MKWRKTSKKDYKKRGLKIGAWLHKYSNTHWEYSVHTWDNNCEDPDYWMPFPFPNPPEMTKKQKEMSERCYRKDKMERIKELEKEIIRVKKEE